MDIPEGVRGILPHGWSKSMRQARADLLRDLNSGTDEEQKTKLALLVEAHFPKNEVPLRVEVVRHGQCAHVRLGFKDARTITLGITPEWTRWGKSKDFSDTRIPPRHSEPTPVTIEAERIVREKLSLVLAPVKVPELA